MYSFIEQVQKELRQAHDKINKADKMDNPDMENLQNLHYRYKQTNNHLRLII